MDCVIKFDNEMQQSPGSLQFITFVNMTMFIVDIVWIQYSDRRGRRSYSGITQTVFTPHTRHKKHIHSSQAYSFRLSADVQHNMLQNNRIESGGKDPIMKQKRKRKNWYLARWQGIEQTVWVKNGTTFPK